MRRTSPDIDPQDAEAIWRKAEACSANAESFAFELITPMYGGGVEAGVVDKAMPIRASALRGQLRYWWRLLYGGELSSEDLFERECKLWGGIASNGPKASQVIVRVKSEPATDAELVESSQVRVPPYALIDQESNPRLLKSGHKFTVSLRFAGTEKQRDEVLEALRWWASFGGVGARTRRGFGALKVVAADTDLAPVDKSEVERLGGRMLTGHRKPALDAWRDAVDALKTFRQHRGAGGTGSTARSNWPEADAIRRASGTHARPPTHADDVYPRAAFGLPIIFHFKDRGDPQDVVLSPENGDRMASPLLLRPYFDGQGYQPLALLLPGWEERIGVQVSLGSAVRPAWPANAGERERLAERIVPMKDHGTDALSAFMEYCKKRFEAPPSGRRR